MPADQPVPEQPTSHRVEWHIEPEHVWGNLICEAAVGADCRMTCPAGCENWPCSHDLEDGGVCNAIEWIDNSDGMVTAYAGDDHRIIDGAVVVTWTGDWYEWTYPYA